MKELKTLTQLTKAFRKFPSIGDKTAERMSYALLNMEDNDINELIKSIKDAKSNIHACPNCGLLTDEKVCSICSDENRDHSTCIVISFQKDVLPFEKSNTYKGIYHCLNGEISTLKGIGPDELRIKELLSRIKSENIKEIIIATNSTLEGETTALYLASILENYDVTVSRVGFGIPMGSNLDYVDELTISKAIEQRKKIN